MFRRNLLLGGAVLWLTACGVQATLTTDQRSYTPGSEVLLRLENDSRQELGYSLMCFTVLQRHEGGSWIPVESTLCAASADMMLTLAPGSRAEEHADLDATLPEGEYRYATTVAWNGESEDVLSNTFNVTRASTP